MTTRSQRAGTGLPDLYLRLLVALRLAVATPATFAPSRTLQIRRTRATCASTVAAAAKCRTPYSVVWSNASNHTESRSRSRRRTSMRRTSNRTRCRHLQCWSRRLQRRSIAGLSAPRHPAVPHVGVSALAWAGPLCTLRYFVESSGPMHWYRDAALQNTRQLQGHHLHRPAVRGGNGRRGDCFCSPSAHKLYP